MGSAERPVTGAERPLLKLGIVGFDHAQRQRLAQAVAGCGAVGEWSLSGLDQADAWAVNGRQVQMEHATSLRIAPAQAGDAPVLLDPAQSTRPIAFALPLAAPEIEPLCTFAIDDAASVQQMLLQLERWLWPVTVQFALGREVVTLGAKLRHGSFHVTRDDTLLAVLDFRKGRGGIARDARPEDFAGARWVMRNNQDLAPPGGFMPVSPAELAWTYARRTRDPLLPGRYREAPIYFRGPPKVPLKWFSDTQLLLVRELASEPSTFTQLQVRCGLAEAPLAHDLACLYFAGSITTSPTKAVNANFGGDGRDIDSSPITRPPGDYTVPASLAQRGMDEFPVRGR